MNDEVKKALEAAIIDCAKKTTEVKTAIEAMQYTQAAVNAANALIGLENQNK